MTYDKAIEEIKRIFHEDLEEHFISHDKLDIDLSIDLSDFLKRFEEGTIEANRESIEESFKENQEPMHNEGYD